jgi:hypothetical protein
MGTGGAGNMHKTPAATADSAKLLEKNESTQEHVLEQMAVHKWLKALREQPVSAPAPPPPVW